MGFATALSGLKAASTSLQVTGNNIANSQTTGFKQSRAEFADVYASSLGGVSRTQAGSGARVTEVAQQFNDGSIEATQNSLDLAISGNGFFVLADEVNLPDPGDTTAPVDPSVPSAYTRNGAFQLNSAGNVVNDKGQYLLAFAPNGTTAEEGFSVGVFRPLTIDTSQGLPNATANINLKLNINGAAVAPTATPFDPTNPDSYNDTTSVTTYDSQGNAHIAATYYVKTPVANVWDTYLFIDNFGITTGGQAKPPKAAPKSTVADAINTPGLPIPVSFNSSGLLEEVGVRAAAVASKAILTSATAVSEAATTASSAAAAVDSDAGADDVANSDLLTQALALSASADAFAVAATTVNSTEKTTAIEYAAVKVAADIAAASAAAYVVAPTALVNASTTEKATAASAAAAAAVIAETDAADALTKATTYNTAVKNTAANATQATQVDFGVINLTDIDPNIKVDPMAFDIDFAGTTQFNNPYSVNGSSQDGLPAGNLTGIDVDDVGVVFAKYSNGGSKALGQVALARFPSNQALSKLGDTTWGKTSNSGTPIYGAAGDNNFGGIQSSALEGSNVDLSDQLVKLIIAQQAYQANSQTITTEKTLVDTILRA